MEEIRSAEAGTSTLPTLSVFATTLLALLAEESGSVAGGSAVVVAALPATDAAAHGSAEAPPQPRPRTTVPQVAGGPPCSPAKHGGMCSGRCMCPPVAGDGGKLM